MELQANYAVVWSMLKARLQERYVMSRKVLEEAGEGQYAALIPIEEVVLWMSELEGRWIRTERAE